MFRVFLFIDVALQATAAQSVMSFVAPPLLLSLGHRVGAVIAKRKPVLRRVRADEDATRRSAVGFDSPPTQARGQEYMGRFYPPFFDC